MEKISIRSYRKGDEFSFFKLDRQLEEHPFNRRSIKNFLWKFKKKNPFGKFINFFSYQGKKIIAHFGAVPLKWIIRNKEVLGSCSIAMMVKPEWQNKGLIKFVGDRVFKSLVKNKVRFVYGYPNQKSYSLHIKLWNYRDFINQKTYILKKKIVDVSNNFVVKEVKTFKTKHDLFWNENKKNYEAILDRNSKFLNWRYLGRPDHKYFCFNISDEQNNLLGYFVLKLYKSKKVTKIHIVDIFFKELSGNDLKQACLSVLQTVYKYKFNENEISFWMNGNKKLVRTFAAIGFKVSEERRMILKKLDSKKEKSIQINPKNFYFTMGDTLEVY